MIVQMLNSWKNMNNFTPRSRVVLAKINEPVIEQPMDETMNDVVVSDIP